MSLKNAALFKILTTTSLLLLFLSTTSTAVFGLVYVTFQLFNLWVPKILIITTNNLFDNNNKLGLFLKESLGALGKNNNSKNNNSVSLSLRTTEVIKSPQFSPLTSSSPSSVSASLAYSRLTAWQDPGLAPLRSGNASNSSQQDPARSGPTSNANVHLQHRRGLQQQPEQPKQLQLQRSSASEARGGGNKKENIIINNNKNNDIPQICCHVGAKTPNEKRRRYGRDFCYRHPPIPSIIGTNFFYLLQRVVLHRDPFLEKGYGFGTKH
jgi:hypothetical protein